MAFLDELKEAQARADIAYGYQQDLYQEGREGVRRGIADTPQGVSAQQQNLLDIARRYGAPEEELRSAVTNYMPNDYPPSAFDVAAEQSIQQGQLQPQDKSIEEVLDEYRAAQTNRVGWAYEDNLKHPFIKDYMDRIAREDAARKQSPKGDPYLDFISAMMQSQNVRR